MSGSWSLDADAQAFQQTAGGTDCRAIYSAPGSAAWADCTITLQARKRGGSEGFLILFHVADTANWFWWNIGGWANTAHGIEQSVNGAKTTLGKTAGSIAVDQWYDIKLVIEGTTVSCYLDDTLIQTVTIPGGRAGGIGLSTWNTQAEFRNIVVTTPDGAELYHSDFSAGEVLAGEIRVDTSAPLNATNPEALALTMHSPTGRVGVANSGFWGIPLQAGARYDLAFHARAAEGFAGPLTARLESADGSRVYATAVFPELPADWQRFTTTLTAPETDTTARLVLSIDEPGTVWLDVVSLFPQQTFRNRPNGMRPDLAGAVAAMKPSFLRFPGGCFVEGNTLANAFRWKKTIGPISERPGHWNLWGYTSTDGLGFHEYLQLCEDLGAEPLFCINAGMSHSDVVPLDQMGEWVQDALDAIEYANGDVTTPWGAKRAAAGHPEPFHLKYLEIGNENGGANYNDRYALFHDAIKAAHPDIQLVANVWGGTPTSRPFDLKDEHYYTDVATMISYATKYDSYSRSGAKVFVGEYAVTRGYGTYGNLAAALGEAAFMTGIERNCDIVAMASYAPLFANLRMMTWKPDAIYFDNARWFGTPAYHVQRLFANNMGTALLPMTQEFSTTRAGSIGLSTWNTQAEFRNIVVTAADGQELYRSDFSAGPTDWTPTSGTWAVTADAYRQSATGNDRRTTYTAPGSTDWKNYTLSLQARKLSGSEGFLVMFHVADANTWCWWNLGGWGNTAHGIEYSTNGTKVAGPRVAGTIATDRWYDIRIAISPGKADCYLDGVLVQTFAFPAPTHSVASYDAATREIILKTVNPTGEPITADIALDGVPAIAPSAVRSLLTSPSPADENTPAAPEAVVPIADTVSTPSLRFPLDLPANSLTILRIQTPPAPPSDFAATAGNQQATLTWTPAAGATTYTIQRATGSDPYATVTSGWTGAAFTDTGLINGTVYRYLVTAVNAAGEATTAAAAVTPTLPPITEADLRSLEIAWTGDDLHLVVKNTTPGRLYTMQWSDDLKTGLWQPLGEPQTGTGADLLFQDPQHPPPPARFYRVLLSE